MAQDCLASDIEQVTLSDLTSVEFPPEDQEAVFNRELHVAIDNARRFGRRG